MMLLKQGDGSTVELTNHNTILKTAHDHEQHTKLRNAVRFHKLLGPKGLAPKLLSDNGSSIEMEYIQEDIDRSNEALFQDITRRKAIQLLLQLKYHNVQHTDLTQYNYIIGQYGICPIDWSEARFGWESSPNKRVGMDADWLYPSLLSHIDDHNRIVRKWLAISPHIRHLRGYGSLADLGCLYGDVTGMAASEGFVAHGFDNGMFDSSWRMSAHQLCEDRVKFNESDIGDIDDFTYDIVLMLSSWSHFVAQTSFTDGEYLLLKILEECGTLFFENHLHGDGPGHKNIQTEEDHIKLFNRMGALAVPITTIDVGGRPFSRTVYKVTKTDY